MAVDVAKRGQAQNSDVSILDIVEWIEKTILLLGQVNASCLFERRMNKGIKIQRLIFHAMKMSWRMDPLCFMGISFIRWLDERSKTQKRTREMCKEMEYKQVKNFKSSTVWFQKPFRYVPSLTQEQARSGGQINKPSFRPTKCSFKTGKRNRPHSVRGASTSKANKFGVSTCQILEMANWSSESTFNHFYNRKVSNEFQNRVQSYKHKNKIYRLPATSHPAGTSKLIYGQYCKYLNLNVLGITYNVENNVNRLLIYGQYCRYLNLNVLEAVEDQLDHVERKFLHIIQRIILNSKQSYTSGITNTTMCSFTLIEIYNCYYVFMINSKRDDISAYAMPEHIQRAAKDYKRSRNDSTDHVRDDISAYAMPEHIQRAAKDYKRSRNDSTDHVCLKKDYIIKTGKQIILEVVDYSFDDKTQKTAYQSNPLSPWESGRYDGHSLSRINRYTEMLSKDYTPNSSRTLSTSTRRC
ncbi:hypothetical protein KUTeg_006540 [Tegillarca granosa]|uniref:Uncharacterized protein n=1 Tax=Tegillarca granosa TaxID=220873 RepID=A0ABQ9FF31_TEGGR|nr:hypothetical protein KUTeg_006540 [Tegillarca granosa]